MTEINEQKSIKALEELLSSKCDKIKYLLPNLESQVIQSQGELEYAFSIIKNVNKELDNLLMINTIENISHEGMKQLEYIFNNIIDKNNFEQIDILNGLLNELKRIYKLQTNNFEQIKLKYESIIAINNKISEFQNEISCKTLNKKPQNT